MASIACPECKRELTDRSEACLHCGFPLATKPFANRKPSLSLEKIRHIAGALSWDVRLALSALVAFILILLALPLVGEDPWQSSTNTQAGTPPDVMLQANDAPPGYDSEAPVANTSPDSTGTSPVGDANLDDINIAASSSTPEPPPAEVLNVSLAKLLGEYNKNEVAGDMAFKDKVLELTGTIQSIGKTLIDEKPEVALSAGDFSLETARCEFEVADRPVIAELKKGARLKIRGECQGKGFMSVKLVRCEIVR